MDEVRCSQCYTHLGWMHYAGPTGSFFCDDCKEVEDAREAEEKETEE